MESIGVWLVEDGHGFGEILREKLMKFLEHDLEEIKYW
jgi:hypothetical protein